MEPNRIFGTLFLIITLFACGKDDETTVGEIKLLSITVNGSALTDGAENIPAVSSISLSFSAALDPGAFESQLSLISKEGTENPDVVYSNSSAKATLNLNLKQATTYTVRVNSGAIGTNGEHLNAAINISFTTQESDVITSLPPCTSPPQCLQSVLLKGSLDKGKFEFYSNYPIYMEKAVWENLTKAVIVVHGASVNPDDYFSYLTNTLNALTFSNSTVLIAPFFREDSPGSANDFHWSNLGYRDGQQSSNPNKISSFQVVDSLIAQLADKERFPVLNQIVVTGQSSGGRFTHLFAPANRSESNFPDIRFDYIVSESQYFYYPDGQRIDENSNGLYTPAGCPGYEIWPFGYQVVPPYLSNVDVADFNEAFVNRHIIYLLGNGSGTDSSLNTSDCNATLLGSTRYQRGENMFRYMELVYAGVHNHSKVIVSGVSHNGSAIYQAAEFRDLLKNILN